MAQTYVLKLMDTSLDAMRLECQARVYRGMSMCAVVQLDVVEPGIYFVQTLDKACNIECFATKIKKEFETLPGCTMIEWVRPFTRRLQRLFGWGDVMATRGDVVRAVAKEDHEELRAIMPKAANLINRDELGSLTALYDAWGAGAPALKDCQHNFYRWTSWTDAIAKRQELGAPRVVLPTQQSVDILDEEDVQGPCIGGPPDATPGKERHMPPYERCLFCRTVCCFACTRTREQESEERTEGLLDLKAAMEECEAELDAFAPSFHWHQHPMHPLPFYVIDMRRISDVEKVRWIRQEYGNDLTLAEFSSKIVELFGGQLSDPKTQKTACLKIYVAYNSDEEVAGWKKESDLPASVLTDFQRVWDPSAPDRCEVCYKRLPGGTSITQKCCPGCYLAGMEVVCTFRDHPGPSCVCTMPAKPIGTWHIMREEGQLDTKKDMRKVTSNSSGGSVPLKDDSLSGRIQANEDTLGKLRTALWCKMCRRPIDEAAQKKRRRS